MTIGWGLAAQWIHNALIEDLMDSAELAFGPLAVQARWSAWVGMLRCLPAPAQA